MMVTTGGRGLVSPLYSSTCASSSLSASSSAARTAVWPSSSVTSTAVSWSMLWVMVAMTPILNSALTTSPPFIASFWARSATVIASPIATSRTTGAVGRVKPVPERDCSAWRRVGRALPRPLVRRARSAADKCNLPAKRAALSSSSTPATIACEPRDLCLGPRSSRWGAGLGWPWPGTLRTAPSSSAGSAAAAAAASASWRRRSASSSSLRLRSAASSARRLSSSARRCCSLRLRWRDSSSLRRISARSSSPDAAACSAVVDASSPAPGLTRVTFLRTTTSTVDRFLPPPTVSSCLRLRLSVIFFGAIASSEALPALPWVRRRKPSSLTFSVLVTTWSGSLNSMPASASCSSSFSTGVFTSAASLRMVVCCDIRFPCPLAWAWALRVLERFYCGEESRPGAAPVGCLLPDRPSPPILPPSWRRRHPGMPPGVRCPGLHGFGRRRDAPSPAIPSAFLLQARDLLSARGEDQRSRTLRVQAVDAELGHFVRAQVRQVLAGAHAVGGQGEGGFLVHAFQRDQVVGRRVLVELFLDRQRVVEQRVAGAGA